jgi:hypothetical protein
MSRRTVPRVLTTVAAVTMVVAGIGFIVSPTEGTYDVKVDGNVTAYLQPSLAFGHDSEYGILPLFFGIAFGAAVVVLVIARVWAARVRRAPVYGRPSPHGEFGSTPT